MTPVVRAQAPSQHDIAEQMRKQVHGKRATWPGPSASEQRAECTPSLVCPSAQCLTTMLSQGSMDFGGCGEDWGAFQMHEAGISCHWRQ